MKRFSATHLYGYLKCPRAVELDLHGDRDLRRPLTEAEELVLRRGRELEDRFVAGLDFVQPEHEIGDFAAGAAATLALLKAGVAGVHQGVLFAPPRLGIPDLLRREDGASALGDFHYVVGDVKSSARPRSDQILQVAFYHRLLTELQQREPDYAYLVLKDGHEERFDPREFAPALDEVDARVDGLAQGRASERPFLSIACSSCRWSVVCEPDLEARGDLSLLQGMTRGMRDVLERAGLRDVAAVRAMKVETVARRTHLEPALLRRLKRAAEARATGAPHYAERAAEPKLVRGAVVHLVGDAFADRVLYFGTSIAVDGEEVVRDVMPESAPAELDAFVGLIGELPADVPLLHYGPALPRWFDGAAWSRRTVRGIEERFVDVARRLRGAAVYPGPVFGLDGHVRYALGADPHRCGRMSEAALWMEGEGAAERLRAKGRADLEDLVALCRDVLFVDRAADDGGRVGRRAAGGVGGSVP